MARIAHKPRPNITKAENSLTSRQYEILRLIADGLSNRETATKLGISVRTVEVHRFNLMRRLRVRNVAQLLRAALLHGILPEMANRLRRRHR